MKKLTLLMVVLMISGFANAQTEFQKLYGDSGIYETWSTIKTYDGGYLIAGNKSGIGTAGYDPALPSASYFKPPGLECFWLFLMLV